MLPGPGPRACSTRAPPASGCTRPAAGPATSPAFIDHTLLKPDATRADIEKLCREAAEFRFATVCVNPTWVALAARLLAMAPAGVCSVVGFPLGATTSDVKHYETQRAIFDGAREIDMVINVGALKSGDLRLVERDIEAVVAPCREAGVRQQGDHRGGAARPTTRRWPPARWRRPRAPTS